MVSPPTIENVAQSGVNGHSRHLPILDGWRAISIIAVIAGHWVPIGPSWWRLNGSVAASGMAIFFTLSGFLITQFLFSRPQVAPFLIRRLARILPLAWAAMIILGIMNQADAVTIAKNMFFLSNLPPASLMEGGHHLWSLCVEMHFYVFAALLVALLGHRALYLLPLACLLVTGLRIVDGEVVSIVTWHRADEILIGACVALAYNHGLLARFAQISGWVVLVLGAALLAVALPYSGGFGYARPYVAGAMIALSLVSAPVWFARILEGAAARYIASISYALYVIHGMLEATPLGGGDADKVTKYILRIPLVALTWLLSHLSTKYFEAYFIAMGRRITTRTVQ